MNCTLIKTYEDIPISGTCVSCGKMFQVKWTIGYPYRMFCSNNCRQRYEELERQGDPVVPKNEYDFWTRLGREKREKEVQNALKQKDKILAQWLKKSKIEPVHSDLVIPKTGSKILANLDSRRSNNGA